MLTQSRRALLGLIVSSIALLGLVASAQAITTVAGGGVGDGNLATSVSIYAIPAPDKLAVASDGTIYIADKLHARIREIDPLTHTITTVAGNGTAGFSGGRRTRHEREPQQPRGRGRCRGRDAVHRRSGQQSHPQGRPLTHTITTVAGNGTAGFSGDGGPATSASLNSPQDVQVASNGTLYITDTNNNRIRMVDPSGTISTIAGTGTACAPATAACGDGAAASAANLAQPEGLALAADGTLYFDDTGTQRVRKIDPGSGTISTVAGSGTVCSPATAACGDGGPATSAKLGGPQGVGVTTDGTLYIADTGINRVREVTPGGTISTVAGTACRAVR